MEVYMQRIQSASCMLLTLNYNNYNAIYIYDLEH